MHKRQSLYLLAILSIVVLVNGCITLPSLPMPQLPPTSSTPPVATGQSTNAIPPAEVQASEWLQTSDADFSAGMLKDVQITKTEGGELTLTGSSSGVYTSTVRRMEPFIATGVQLVASIPSGSSVQVQVRAGQNNSTFGAWQDIEMSNESNLDARYTDATLPPHLADRVSGELYIFPDSNLYLQYRLTLLAGNSSAPPVVKEVKLTGINARNGPGIVEAQNSITVQSIDAPPIISRAGWGANEKYRYDDKQEEIWKREYVRPTKFIIHHTVTPNNEANPVATLRTIYYYHAVTLEWGDIGYNYLIDWKGNIYEGRAGGENVVAGHAKEYNYGSIGIAVMGTYHTGRITAEAEQALVKLIAWKADQLAIEPKGDGFFIDHVMPNIMGHRDAMPGKTTCPGDGFYAQLPEIRDGVEAAVSKVEAEFTTQRDNPWVGGQNVIISAVGRADGGVSKIELFLNESLRATSTGDSISYTWDARNWPEGRHTFKVVVTDKWGKTAQASKVVMVDNQPPVFSNALVLNSTVTVNVQDAASGLAVNSAQYQLGDDTGWGQWQSAPVSGADGTTGSETVTVAAIPSTAKQIRFRINDMANNTVESAAYPLTPATPRPSFARAESRWYFAEGSTTPGYDTWLLLQNPNTMAASVSISYHKADGSVTERSYKIEAMSRLSIWVNKEIPNMDMAMRVTADLPVFAERAMYSGHDGHTSLGIPDTAKTWYFAEGYTGAGFDTWLLLFNPNNAAAKVRVRYLTENSQPVTKEYQVLPNARLSIWANKEVPNAQLAFIVDSDQGIVAERSMYFDPRRQASHNSAGATTPAKVWYLAEGTTSAPTDTWLLLLNPGAAPAKAKLTYYKSDGSTQFQDVIVAPSSRLSVWVNKVMPDTAFSTKVEADQDIIVERSMYFGESGGHNSVGVTQPAQRWFHPEGSTNPTFNTFFLVMNPNPVPATVRVTFMGENGITTVRQYVVNPNTRFTIWANRELPQPAFSTLVESDQPIISERSTYFQNNTGGTNSPGVPAP